MVAPAASYDHVFKLILIGDSGVGKSSILLRFSEGIFNDDFISTIGIDFKIRTIETGGKRIKLSIWDTAGQEHFRTITRAFYRAAKAVVLVYDITDESSFTNIRNWIANIEEHNTGVHMILVGNKADVDEKRRAVEQRQGQELADEYRITFFETSARIGLNVDQVFHSLAEEILQGVPCDGAETEHDTVRICKADEDGGVGSKGCCVS